MTDPDAIARQYAARRWATVDIAALGPAQEVPSMLGDEESRLYHWIGTQAQGTGATVDLGAFAGGSAARLLSGLALSGQSHALHAYDFFTATGKTREKFLPGLPGDARGSADILPLVQRHLAPWAGAVTLHRGDIGTARWHGGPIEILAIDAAKTAPLADHIAAEFLTSLIPGQSVVIHQDFLHPVLPWIPAQMVRLAGCFRPLARVTPDCLVFLCTQRPDPDDLDRAATAALSDADLSARVTEAADWLAAFAPRARFDKARARISANPGVRIGWKMKA